MITVCRFWPIADSKFTLEHTMLYSIKSVSLNVENLVYSLLYTIEVAGKEELIFPLHDFLHHQLLQHVRDPCLSRKSTHNHNTLQMPLQLCQILGTNL